MQLKQTKNKQSYLTTSGCIVFLHIDCKVVKIVSSLHIIENQIILKTYPLQSISVYNEFKSTPSSIIR